MPRDWIRLSLNLEMIRNLLERDLASINYQNSEGTSLLMLAATHSSDAQGVRLLHESGARTCICDNEGRMALHFAAESGNVELLQYILEHTETNCIDQWFRNVPNVLQKKGVLYSLLCCAINSKNKTCFEILLFSPKLSKSILHAPYIRKDYSARHLQVYSPMAYLFCSLVNFTNEKLNSYVQLLLNHEVKLLDEFFRIVKLKWSRGQVRFFNPFSKILSHFYLSRQCQRFYFKWLNENNLTIDYCLQCNPDNSQPFITFSDYKLYYEPALDALTCNHAEALKLIMSSSAILEPDELIIQFNKKSDEPNFINHCVITNKLLRDPKLGDVRKNIYKYLISLKPIYYKIAQMCNKTSQSGLSWYPYATAGEEFSNSTLQQLCRTTIRHHTREYTVEGNLRNFRKNISELPLPPKMTRFLLFES